MKSAESFKEINLLHAKYQNRMVALDEEIAALKREKEELAASSDVIYALYRTSIPGDNASDVDIEHGFMKASLAELDQSQKIEFRSSKPLPYPDAGSRASAKPISRCVDSALWTLFAMKLREERSSLEKRIESMVSEHVARNAFTLERLIDEYEYVCKAIWESCEQKANFKEVVTKVVEDSPEGVYCDEEVTRVTGHDCRYEARLAVRACARVRHARTRLNELVGRR